MSYWTSGDSRWTDACLTANDDGGGVGDIACGCCQSQQPSTGGRCVTYFACIYCRLPLCCERAGRLCCCSVVCFSSAVQG